MRKETAMKIRLTAMMLILSLGILSGCTVSALQPEVTVPSPAVIPAAPAPVPTEPAAVPAEPAAVPAEPAPAAPAAGAAASSYLSREEAIAIALKDTGLEENQVSRLKAEFDYDDGRPEYDVEFRYDIWEYEYEIHAESGKILNRDKDRDD